MIVGAASSSKSGSWCSLPFKANYFLRCQPCILKRRLVRAGRLEFGLNMKSIVTDQTMDSSSQTKLRRRHNSHHLHVVLMFRGISFRSLIELQRPPRAHSSLIGSIEILKRRRCVKCIHMQSSSWFPYLSLLIPIYPCSGCCFFFRAQQ